MNAISEHWEILIGGIAAIFSYIAGKGKRQHESLSAMQESYEKFVQDWKEKYDDLKNQLTDLDHQVNTLHKENTELKEDLNKWKKMYAELKNEFNAYRKSKGNQ